MLVTYKVFSILLSYPNQDIKDCLEDVCSSLKAENILSKSGIESIGNFINEVSTQDLMDWQELYVGSFDYNRSVSLHLFEHIHGDSKDRGQAMVDLLSFYTENGYKLEGNELPDYLPAFLEFLSLQDSIRSADLLADIIDIVGFIHNRLEEKKNIYSSIFYALIELSSHKPQTYRVDKLKSQNSEMSLDETYEQPITFSNNSDLCNQCKLNEHGKLS